MNTHVAHFYNDKKGTITPEQDMVKMPPWIDRNQA